MAQEQQPQDHIDKNLEVVKQLTIQSLLDLRRPGEIPYETGDNLLTQIKKGRWNNMVRNWDSTHPEPPTNPSE